MTTMAVELTEEQRDELLRYVARDGAGIVFCTVLSMAAENGADGRTAQALAEREQERYDDAK